MVKGGRGDAVWRDKERTLAGGSGDYTAVPLFHPPYKVLLESSPFTWTTSLIIVFLTIVQKLPKIISFPDHHTIVNSGAILQ